MRKSYYKRVYFPFHAVGSQDGKSSLNPKAPAFSTSGSNSPTCIGYAKAATCNMTGEGICLCLVYMFARVWSSCAL